MGWGGGHTVSQKSHLPSDWLKIEPAEHEGLHPPLKPHLKHEKKFLMSQVGSVKCDVYF